MRLPCKGNLPPPVLAMAWQPKSLNSLVHQMQRSVSSFSLSYYSTVFQPPAILCSSSSFSSSSHPQHAKLPLCRPLRTSFPYFIPSGPSAMFGSTLSLHHADFWTRLHRVVLPSLSSPERPWSTSITSPFLSPREILTIMHQVYQTPPMPVQSGPHSRLPIDRDRVSDGSIGVGIHLGVELEILRARCDIQPQCRCSPAIANASYDSHY